MMRSPADNQVGLMIGVFCIHDTRLVAVAGWSRGKCMCVVQCVGATTDEQCCTVLVEAPCLLLLLGQIK
jgi:hypothetical protein